MNLRGHALTTLFWAALAAWCVLHFADFETSGFDDRIVSNATLHGVDVGARIRLYLAALLAFVSAGLILYAGLARLSRIIGDGARANLEHASFVGLVLVFFAGVTSLETDAVMLCAALEVAYVVCVLAKARVRAGERDQHGAVFLIVAAAAYAVLAVTPWRTQAWAVALLTVLALTALTIAERAGRQRDVALALGCAAAAAFIPLALVLREEFVLIANQRGIGVSHAVASITCTLALLVVGFFVAQRRPFDAERALARVTLPALILGFTFSAAWTPTRDPPHEMLEFGNAGLALQQWFEHGRWPFFDTLDVHGLSDCAMGFLYSCANGWSGIAWQHWDFVPYASAQLAVYVILARTLGHAPLAFVLVIASPFVRALFPPEVVMAAVFALVAAWSAHRGSRAACAWAAIAWIALVLWRIDLGGAAAIALALTWAAAHAIERPVGFAWKRALAGVVPVAVVAFVLVFVVARARDVSLFARFDEFRRIASSDAAFGRARIFEGFDAAVAFRLLVAPALTIMAAVVLVLRARQLGEAARERRFATYALLFLAAFSLVIFTRGLVRHTFVEHDATYVTAFQFAVIALTLVVAAPLQWRRISITAALALHALLPLAFDVSLEKSRTIVWRSNTLARASIRIRGWQRTEVGTERFDRTPVTSEFRANNIEPLRALKHAVLEPGETFVDLSASPMLYVFSGARSPHWANHLIVLQGDVLQKRFLTELEGERAPLFVMRQEYGLAEQAGMTPDVMIDQIPIALWHARIFDELMSRSEPLVMAGRWQVWARSDWAPQRAWGPAGETLGELPIGKRSIIVTLEPGQTLSLSVSGRSTSDARLAIEANIENEAFHETITREVAWPPTARFELVDVVTAARPTMVEIRQIDARDGLTLERMHARLISDPARAEAATRAETPLDTVLGQTAFAWGAYDRSPRQTVLGIDGASGRARAVEPGAFERFTFAPPPRAERSLLCELTLSNPGARPATAVVRYGVGDLVGGTFRFDLAADARPAAYVFRPGMQANWHRRPNSWIEIGSPEAAITVHAARLCAND